jgi:oxygen-dependent protoporphyrinogen oxidase
VIGRVRGDGGDKRTARGLHAPIGGVGALVAALAESLGDRVRTDARVRAIAPAQQGVTIDGERWDGVVLAIPAEDAAALVVDTIPELAAKLDAFYRAPVAIVYLGFPADSHARDGFGFLVAGGEDVRVLGCVFESIVWPDRAPAGCLLLRCIFGGGRDPEVTALPTDDLISLARRDVATVLGIDAAPVHASVVTSERGIAQYRVGHRDRVREAEALARVHRIALAGADYRGPGVNDLCADASVVVAGVTGWG